MVELNLVWLGLCRSRCNPERAVPKPASAFSVIRLSSCSRSLAIRVICASAPAAQIAAELSRTRMVTSGKPAQGVAVASSILIDRTRSPGYLNSRAVSAPAVASSRASLSDWSTYSPANFDEDECPVALTFEHGTGASVVYVDRRQNRRAGGGFRAISKRKNTGPGGCLQLGLLHDAESQSADRTSPKRLRLNRLGRSKVTNTWS